MSILPRPICPRCRRPQAVCYCEHLPLLSTRTRVVLLQHPRERDMPIGTAHMASLCLEGSELHVGISFEGVREVSAAIGDPARPAYLLYPGEGALDVDREPPPGPVTLVVVDGTWAHARSLLRHNPSIKALPRLSFSPAAPSEYRIRREPRDDYVSTIEALAHVLGALEGDSAAFSPMLAPFRAMVDMQIEHRARLRTSRHRRPRVPAEERAARRLPQLLRDRPGDLLCITAEANAWPYSPPSPYPDELVHWVAFRPATGERFEAVVSPRQPLSPGTPMHTGLSREVLAAGVSPGAFREAWAAFVRPGDVACAWGMYGLGLLAAEGCAPPAAFVDLRSAAGAFLGGRVGTLEACRERLSLPPPAPLGQGRGGVRLALTSAIASYLARAAGPASSGAGAAAAASHAGDEAPGVAGGTQGAV
jgi:DTW domain-containing protein